MSVPHSHPCAGSRAPEAVRRKPCAGSRAPGAVCRKTSGSRAPEAVRRMPCAGSRAAVRRTSCAVRRAPEAVCRKPCAGSRVPEAVRHYDRWAVSRRALRPSGKTAEGQGQGRPSGERLAGPRTARLLLSLGPRAPGPPVRSLRGPMPPTPRAHPPTEPAHPPTQQPIMIRTTCLGSFRFCPCWLGRESATVGSEGLHGPGPWKNVPRRTIFVPRRAKPPRDPAPLRTHRQPEQTQTRASRCWLASAINPRIRALPRRSAGFTVKSFRASCATPCAGSRARYAMRRKPRRRKPSAGSRAPEAVRRKPCAGSRAPEAVRRKPCAGSRAPEAVRRAPYPGSRAPKAVLLLRS
jgi:hypothetical protein